MNTESPRRVATVPPSLHIEDYYVDRLEFHTRDGYDGISTTLLESDLNINVQFGQHQDDARNWVCRVSISSAEKTHTVLAYVFEITLVGVFKVHDSFPIERMERMVNINAPAILYSSAREILAMATSRGRFNSLSLPTVSFLPAEPRTPSLPEAKAERPKSATKKRSISTKSTPRKSR